jgi:hypothetical protein
LVPGTRLGPVTNFLLSRWNYSYLYTFVSLLFCSPFSDERTGL